MMRLTLTTALLCVALLGFDSVETKSHDRKYSKISTDKKSFIHKKNTIHRRDVSESTLPGQPQAIHVLPMEDSILVSWTPPAEQDIMIRGYVLGYGGNVPDAFQEVLTAEQRSYTIENLLPNSEYVISLRAFNNIGEGMPRYETAKTRRASTPIPQTPMDPPVGLTAVVLSASTVVLTWTDISLGDSQRINDDRYYTVAFNLKTSHNKKFINCTDLYAYVDDLRPDTEYEFSVKVTLGDRHSSPSMSIFAKTHESIPATPPRDLTPVVYPNEPTWVTLSWQPPLTPNGQLTGYRVFYSTDATVDDESWVEDRLPGDMLSTVIQDLSLDTTYYFMVQAENSKGYGPPSPIVTYRTPSVCDEGEWQCDNGQCIDPSYKCDGIGHCYDDSDEEGCEVTVCRSGRWQCDNGKCIHSSWQCDNYDDCGDNSDERDCEFECPSDKFQCDNGNCIYASWECDFVDDCSDNSDESHCECPEDRFKCDNGQCLYGVSRCDYYDDCGDNSDEQDCDFPECGEDEWQCDNKRCIRKFWRCDQEDDCGDNSDENEDDCENFVRYENEEEFPWYH